MGIKGPPQRPEDEHSLWDTVSDVKVGNTLGSVTMKYWILGKLFLLEKNERLEIAQGVH